MRTWIAFLRGINVLGASTLKMKDLVALLEDLGLEDVRTYIQSGNAVFRSDDDDPARLAAAIGSAIEERHGFAPRVLVMTREDLQTAADANPFPEAEPEPKSLHLNFLEARPHDPDLDGLEAVRKENERFVLTDRVFYLHAPDGIGRSKLAGRAERLLGVPMTGRNWRTVQKVLALAEDDGS